jgi:hypothetical protein
MDKTISPMISADNYDHLADIRESYLKLVEDTLTGIIYEDSPLAIDETTSLVYDPIIREYGWDWPSKAFTMIGAKRMVNFRCLIENVIAHQVQGDIVETGVWRGGACIFARAVLKAYHIMDRKIILCDSFRGLPAPDASKYPEDASSNFHEFSELAVSLEQVKENFRRFSLLDDQVVFVEGLFRDTMPRLNLDAISVLRLDGDMYESTIDPLHFLYDRISVGGWVIIDDYEIIPACKAAVHAFLAERALEPELIPIDGVGCYFRKEAL